MGLAGDLSDGQKSTCLPSETKLEFEIGGFNPKLKIFADGILVASQHFTHPIKKG